MRGLLQDMIDERGRMFMARDFDGLIRLYALPLAVWMDGAFRPLPDRASMLQALAEHRAAIEEQDVTGLTGRMVAQAEAPAGKFRVFVDWIYSFETGEDRRASTTYYGSLRDDEPVIEMVEYRQLAFGDVPRWVRALTEAASLKTERNA